MHLLSKTILEFLDIYFTGRNNMLFKIKLMEKKKKIPTHKKNNSHDNHWFFYRYALLLSNLVKIDFKHSNIHFQLRTGQIIVFFHISLNFFLKAVISFIALFLKLLTHYAIVLMDEEYHRFHSHIKLRIDNSDFSIYFNCFIPGTKWAYFNSFHQWETLMIMHS